MKFIIVSDIFGHTEALENLARLCFKERFEFEIFSPYIEKGISFKDESEAYQYFTTHVGLDKYTEDLRRFLMSFSQPPFSPPIVLVGFSVGASAIWRLSEHLSKDNVLEAICFYGSQIRNFTQVIPSIKTTLIFPKYETHFSVDDLIELLECKTHVRVERTQYLHGFMNQLSQNFDVNAYQEYVSVLSNYRE